MVYYEFKLKSESPFKIPKGKGDTFREWTQKINNETDEQNRLLPYNVNFFVVNAKPENIILCGIIGYKNTQNPKDLAQTFASGLGFEATGIEGGEIDIHTLGQLAREADRNGFIDDDDAILFRASIGCFNQCVSHDYSEFFAKELPFGIKEARKMAEETNCGQSLIDEIERIYTKQRQRTFIGNPVHYILYCDDWEIAQRIVEVLGSALYQNGRLKSRRIALIKAETPKRRHFLDDEEDRMDLDLCEKLFESQRGCTLVIKPGKTAVENFTAREEDFHIEQIASLIKQYMIETLSITVLNKTEKEIGSRLRLSLSQTRFVEIEEEAFFNNKAAAILKKMAKADNISDCKSLITKLPKDEKAFYMSDVSKIYSQWLSERLPVEVYPQYNCIKKPDLTGVRDKGDAYSKLQSLIGLGRAKQVIQQALDFNKAQSYYKLAGLETFKPSRHMVFTGNPGTAKTTVARLFAQIMKDNGVLEKGDLIEVGRKDLVGKYVGWTAKLVEEAFEKAQGSVLFIDEAYSLCDDKAGLFGDEAINTIVQVMENQRNNTVVIFAGYPDKMEVFLDKNPGLRSRIAYHVSFDDYSTEDLVKIFKLIADENRVCLAEGVEDKLRNIFAKTAKGIDFGNGRYVRNVFEQARMKQASRLVHMNANEVTSQVIKTLTVEDLTDEMTSSAKQESRVLGFAC